MIGSELTLRSQQRIGPSVSQDRYDARGGITAQHTTPVQSLRAPHPPTLAPLRSARSAMPDPSEPGRAATVCRGPPSGPDGPVGFGCVQNLGTTHSRLVRIPLSPREVLGPRGRRALARLTRAIDGREGPRDAFRRFATPLGLAAGRVRAGRRTWAQRAQVSAPISASLADCAARRVVRTAGRTVRRRSAGKSKSTAGGGYKRLEARRRPASVPAAAAAPSVRASQVFRRHGPSRSPPGGPLVSGAIVRLVLRQSRPPRPDPFTTRPGPTDSDYGPPSSLVGRSCRRLL